jgi:hypothetical protein
MDLESSDRSLIMKLPQDLPDGTKKSHEKPVMIVGVSTKILGSSRIRVKSVIAMPNSSVKQL